MRNIALRSPSRDIPPETHGLWSLWDMLDIYGYRIAALVEQIKAAVHGHTTAEGFDPNGKSPPLDGTTFVGVTVNTAASLIQELQLKSSLYQINTLRRGSLLGMKFGDLLRELSQLKVRVAEDLRERYFLFVSPGMHVYWGKKDAFDLGKKFPDAQYDIEHAGNCLAVSEGTACVMHLARAMDAVLGRLAKKLKITIGGKDSWGVILNAMAGKINKMPEATPAQKNKRDRWSEARVHLFHVKEAWRDRPLHAKQTYTSERAREIYEAVRVFVNHLAAL